ncbi:hypothetical protein [Ottowia sp.]|uniref:hypothetical protein n=1 Tax=Ottowia sp. TaxID=1898956 RepID=UPI0026129924|nr:hypothetical protein [Ottowia sp.]
MTSSPTPSTRIRSRSERPGAVPAALAACLLAALPRLAAAHGETVDVLPEQPGLRLGAGAALSALHADEELPSRRMSGYLLNGSVGTDRRGGQLEHGVIEAAARLSSQFGAYAAIGKHGSEAPHTEGAWLQWQPGPDWQLTLGRQKPSLGAVITGAGHMDRFALMPLAKQASFGEDWIDDGLQASWRHPLGSGDVGLDVGLWRGHAWPGGYGRPLGFSAHAQWQQGDWTLDGFFLHAEPARRGTKIILAGADHSHGAADCDAALTQVACFGGRSQVLGASVRWLSHQLPLSASAAVLWHRDRGSLASRNGGGAYAGDTVGGWVEGVWTLHSQWELGVRLEHLRSRQTLVGAGASLVASELQLAAYRPADRQSLMLGWLPSDKVSVRLEVGRESVSGRHARYASLRAVVAVDDVVRGARALAGR